MGGPLQDCVHIEVKLGVKAYVVLRRVYLTVPFIEGQLEWVNLYKAQIQATFLLASLLKDLFVYCQLFNTSYTKG